MWDVRTKDVNSLWAENAERENLLTGVELEVEAWRDSECWRNDCDDWRWPFGNFCVTFQRKPTYMHAYHRVSFKRADLKRILDGRLPSNGGRKPKEIEWRAFWHTMIGLERQGLLKTFTTQAELSEAVLEEIRDELSEQSIRTDVSQIFKKFCVSAP